jgi:hypothetical protein
LEGALIQAGAVSLPHRLNPLPDLFDCTRMPGVAMLHIVMEETP